MNLLFLKLIMNITFDFFFSGMYSPLTTSSDGNIKVVITYYF